jgi:hypothetical protein
LTGVVRHKNDRHSALPQLPLNCVSAGEYGFEALMEGGHSSKDDQKTGSRQPHYWLSGPGGMIRRPGNATRNAKLKN